MQNQSFLTIIFIFLCFGTYYLKQYFDPYYGKYNILGLTPKVYKINLDLSYKDRWREFILDNQLYLDDLQSILYEQHPYIHKYSILIQLAALFQNTEFINEIKAIAELADFDQSLLILINFMYELQAFCTQIIFQQQDGKVYHQRTLDLSGIQEILAHITGEGHFYKNGQLIFKSAIVAGFTGVHTGLRMDQYSIAINTKLKMKKWPLIQEVLFKSTVPIPYYIRQLLENKSTYEDAVQGLQHDQISGEVFFVIAGRQENQGVVITRTQSIVQNQRKLNDKNWYLIQTNYELSDKKNKWDIQYKSTQNLLEKISQQKVSNKQVFERILTKQPVFYPSTCFTASMSAGSNNYFNMTLWKRQYLNEMQ